MINSFGLSAFKHISEQADVCVQLTSDMAWAQRNHVNHFSGKCSLQAIDLQ